MKSFEYAKNRNKNNSKKWYIVNINNYRIYIWGLPFVPFVLAYEKISDYLYDRRVWNEKTATAVLNYSLPYVLEWVEDDNAYYYCMDWHYSHLWRKAPLMKRKWAKKFAYKLQQFIKEGYEHSDYIKTIENDGYDTWIKFEKNS